jgi:hypothetical protein
MSKATSKTAAPAAADDKDTTPTDSEANSSPPLTKNWRGQLRVGSVINETLNVKTIRLLPASGERYLPFTYVPGQFLNLL